MFKKFWFKNKKQGIMLVFPELRQTYSYDCGASALESVLLYYGIEKREDILITQAKTTPLQGTSVEHLLDVLKKYHLKTIAKQMTLDEVKNFLRDKIPVILLLQAWTNKKHDCYKNDWDDGHYGVAIGYDSEKIYFEDPSTFERDYLTFAELLERWHDTDGKKKYYNYGIAVYGKKPKFTEHKILHMD